ncbi:MAG: FixH family protein [Pseudomonadota bacterium]
MTEAETAKPFTGWHALAWLAGFFGLMFVVNGIFLYQAITSFPGEDTKKSYLQGLNYNDVLAARAEQAAMGWRAEIGIDGNRFRFVLRDGAHFPLGGYDVSAEFRHRVTTRLDTKLTLSSTGIGEYTAPIDKLGSGIWDVIVYVRTPTEGEDIFAARKTVQIK